MIDGNSDEPLKWLSTEIIISMYYIYVGLHRHIANLLQYFLILGPWPAIDL